MIETGRSRAPTTLLRVIPGVNRAVWLATGAGLLAAVMTIGQMIVLGRIVGSVLLSHKGLDAVVPLIAAAAFLMLLRATLIFGREMAAQRTAIRVKETVRARLLQHLLQLGPAYLRGERTGELLVTATDGIERLDAYTARYLPQRFLSVGIPLLVAAVVGWYDWVSAVLLVCSAPIILILMVLIGSYTQERVEGQWETLGRLGAQFLDVIQGLPTLVLFDREGAGRQRVVESSEAFRTGTLSVLRIASISGATLELMSSVAIGLVAATLGVRLLDGGIAFDHAFVVFLLTPEFYRPLRELAIQRHAAMEGEVAARRIVEVIETPVTAAAPSSLPRCGVWPGIIDLLDLTYAYPGCLDTAVDHVRMTLYPGTCTALVGRSGAGKTTVVNLLLRFIEPSGGTIGVDGIPINLVSSEEWRTRVGLVPQRPYLFRGSIRDNVRLARPNASDGDIARAVSLAGAEVFIRDLPDGYDTIIGERGVGLSAGQVQRLAIARAFLKDAPLLVLDEPTSALDPESEEAIQGALIQLMRDRTVLVIAHRLNTVRVADQIAVLERGRLAEIGTHEELLHKSADYHHLIRARVTDEAPV